MQNICNNGHYKGLYLLFCVEMWERFSFYGMRALIVLYMVQALSYSVQRAGNIYGLYTGLVYLTPLIGGYIADRYLGQRKCITIGAVLMSLGLFTLAFGVKSLFLTSLFLMIAANGFFKSNISSVLGLLYEKTPEKKDSAFTVFYMGINLGAFFSPLVCGTLAVKYGFEWGFASAGFGMLAGLLFYKLYEHKYLGESGLMPIGINRKETASSALLNKEQKNQLLSLIFLMLFTIPFWICFEQAGSSLTLFAQYNINRNFMGHEIPAGYFQSLNPLFIIVFAPVMSCLWELLRKRTKEPSSVQKFAVAHFLMFISYVVLAYAGYISENNLITPLWLIFGYFIMTISELCLSPIGLSLVSKLAPRNFLSLTMGCWFLTSFFGNLISGMWGGQYSNISIVMLFGSLAILSITTCIVLVCFMKILNKYIK